MSRFLRVGYCDCGHINCICLQLQGFKNLSTTAISTVISRFLNVCNCECGYINRICLQFSAIRRNLCRLWLWPWPWFKALFWTCSFVPVLKLWVFSSLLICVLFIAIYHNLLHWQECFFPPLLVMVGLGGGCPILKKMLFWLELCYV